ncbi:MAG: hypothetical protein ACE5E1_09800 [Phycisphaerae bacterium]
MTTKRQDKRIDRFLGPSGRTMRNKTHVEMKFRSGQSGRLRRVVPTPLAALVILIGAASARAGQATTSASAASNGRGPGTAAASAAYNGRGPGFAQTRTRSGRVSFGRGIAFGMDRNGVSFSASQAVAPRFGPAVATNFNLSVGFDGRVSGSRGLSIAGGSRQRAAHAGGFARARRGRTSAMSTASGRTGRRGYVRAMTRSHTHRPRLRWWR